MSTSHISLDFGLFPISKDIDDELDKSHCFFDVRTFVQTLSTPLLIGYRRHTTSYLKQVRLYLIRRMRGNCTFHLIPTKPLSSVSRLTAISKMSFNPLTTCMIQIMGTVDRSPTGPKKRGGGTVAPEGLCVELGPSRNILN